MTNQIQAIDRSSVHRICSGQVILDLSIAMKELVENSLDAGATRVEVRTGEHGAESIVITDNGSGIEPANYAALAQKHFTSKIKDFKDLETVASFGFRGEALSSLCALADLTVVTMCEGEGVGTQLVYDKDGKLVSQKPLATNRGTIVTLEGLFKTLPVRFKSFQKNLKREYGKMTTLLKSYALVRLNLKIQILYQLGTNLQMNLTLTKFS
jgi:DNA mismatch repair protein PMS2